MMRRLGATLITLAAAAGVMCAGAPAASADDSVTPMCNGQPCTGGWYTSPVTVTWLVSPPPDHTIDCAGVQPTSHDLVATTSCEAVWPSDDIKRVYTVHVELSSPSATGTLTRPPDSNGWYNHPVTASFAGNAFSGIASCTSPTTYAGPAGSNVTLNGSCTDNAGKTANTSVSFNYDGTPPTVDGAVASRRPDAGGRYTHPVTFTFTGTDAASGIAGCDTVTYRGPSDGKIVGGCHDRAGNYATLAVPVRYRQATPRASITRVRASILLRWKATPGASYYNVQIFRAGKKVLSAWPSRASLWLRRSWTFSGRRFALSPGRYRWYVWPGYGSRAAAHYGRSIVASAFKVTRRH